MLTFLMLACAPAPPDDGGDGDGGSDTHETVYNYLPPTDLDSVPEEVPGISVPAIVVNEIMSDNESTLQEADGSFHDWFEIYNASDESVALDRVAVWRKDAAWLGSGGNLDPGAFVLVKADGGLTEESAPFTLSSDGNTLTVTVDGIVSDAIDPGPLPSDVAALRFPDGGAWRFGVMCTPGAANIEEGTDSLDARDSIFQAHHIPVLEITLSEDSYQSLLHNGRKDVEASIVFDGISFPSVNVKLKGSGSYQGLNGKSAFKIDLNDYDSTRRMRGLKKLTFNNGVTWDPTWTHEYLTYSLFREAGIAAPRVGWARIFLNGVDYGLYMNVETWDDELIERWFTDAATGGSLYEGSDFNYSISGFRLEEGPDRTDWLQAVADHIGTSPTSDDMAALGKLIDLDEFTTYMAIEDVTLQWDGYEAPNNWRLYVSADGIGSWVPTGVDYTWSFPQGNCWYGHGSVFVTCLNDPDCYDLYTHKLIEVSDLADSMNLVDTFNELTAFLTPDIKTDERTPHSPNAIASAQAKTLNFLTARPEQCRTEAMDDLGK